MNLVFFSLKVDFFTPKVAAAELARRLSPGRARTSSPSEPFHLRIPSLTQATLAKIDIRSKNARFICRQAATRLGRAQPEVSRCAEVLRKEQESGQTQ